MRGSGVVDDAGHRCAQHPMQAGHRDGWPDRRATFHFIKFQERLSLSLSVPLRTVPRVQIKLAPPITRGLFLCWGLSGATAHAAFVLPLPQMDLCCGGGFGMPRTLKPLRIVARICTSATYRPKSRVERRWAIVGPSGGLAILRAGVPPERAYMIGCHKVPD